MELSEYSKRELTHLLGDKTAKLSLFSDDDVLFNKEARYHYSELEKLALIEEDGTATNFANKMDISGTHYETSSAAEIAQMIIPLKGL